MQDPVGQHRQRFLGVYRYKFVSVKRLKNQRERISRPIYCFVGWLVS